MSDFNVSVIVWAKSQDSVHKPQVLKREKSSTGSNLGPSAYQPSALPQGQTGSLFEMSFVYSSIYCSACSFVPSVILSGVFCIAMCLGREHSKPLPKEQRWLPISNHIKYKMSCMCNNAVTASTSKHLAELLQTYTPPYTSQSAADACTFKIPLCKKKCSGQRSFFCQSPMTWNNLTFSLHHSETYISFKSQRILSNLPGVV